MKFTTMLYNNKKIKINQANVHAITPTHLFPLKFTGLNIKITLPKTKQNINFTKISNKKLSNKKTINVYILGKNNEKIPVEIHAGNLTNDLIYTDCFYGYINPTMFDVR